MKTNKTDKEKEIVSGQAITPASDDGFAILTDFYAKKQENENSVTSTTTPTTTPSLGLAAKIAAAQRQQRIIGTPVAGMIPNAEQEAILEVASDSKLQVLVVAAGAGTGKTATLKMLEQVLPGKGQYTAFNTSLVDESKTKFTKASCNTTHSLAFRAIGRQYKHRLGGDRMRSHQIAKILGVEAMTVVVPGHGKPDAEGNSTDLMKVIQADVLTGKILAAIRKFCQSDDKEITADHFPYIDGIDYEGRANNNRVRSYLLPFAHKAWNDLINPKGSLPFSHDHYVKIWQLGEGNNKPIIAADYILLDEAQDTAPVFLDILRRQTHALLILVGDDNQQIYEWRGAVNAMSTFPGAPRRLLSQSYRFGQVIADVANSVLSTLQEPTDLVMRGLPSIPSRVDKVADPKCYLYRTNAGAVSRLMNAISEGKHPHLIGGSKDVCDFCQAAIDLQAMRGTRHPELSCFETWEEVVEYSESDEGNDLALMVKLINKFGAQAIRDALKDMPDEDKADVIISTAHKSKGREWDTVRLGPDFPLSNQMTDADRRLLYVAATRAKLTLDISECPPFCGGRDRQTGDWVYGLDVTYTTEMPSQESLAEWMANRDAGTNSPAFKPPSPAPIPPAKIAPTEANGRAGFNWARVGDKWGVRGPKEVNLGELVTVTRKDGSSSKETLKSVLKRYDDAWIYEV